MSGAKRLTALFTDLYELTMARVYWQQGKQDQATFSLFFRRYPPERGFFVFAGLAAVLDYLENWRFAEEDLDYLRRLPHFPREFLDYLATLRFTGQVRALPEGSIFFAEEPVLEVTAPLIQGQLVETYLLNEIHVQTLLATKAARVVLAARGRTLVDFAARRTQGDETADKLARVAYLVGFQATSNVRAGARYGIPLAGTMAHSYVTVFASELEAFRQYAATFPESSIFLVDTYDTLQGVRKAIQVAQEMKAAGHQLQAIRLDSGDLLALSRQARALLDEAGLAEVQIFASGGLDEFRIAALLEAGAPIDGFGVGTKVGVSADAPWADCAYKLVAYAGRPVLKLSPRKDTLPGPKQVFRFAAPSGVWEQDVLACAEEQLPGGRPLLQEVMREGRRLAADPPLSALRQRFQAELAALPPGCKALRQPQRYPVRRSPALEQLLQQTRAAIQQRELPAHLPPA